MLSRVRSKVLRLTLDALNLRPSDVCNVGVIFESANLICLDRRQDVKKREIDSGICAFLLRGEPKKLGVHMIVGPKRRSNFWVSEIKIP